MKGQTMDFACCTLTQAQAAKCTRNGFNWPTPLWRFRSLRQRGPCRCSCEGLARATRCCVGFLSITPISDDNFAGNAITQASCCVFHCWWEQYET